MAMLSLVAAVLLHAQLRKLLIAYRGGEWRQILRRDVAVPQRESAGHLALFLQHRHGAGIRARAARTTQRVRALSHLPFT